MSLGIFPVFQPPLIGTKFEGLGEAIAANLKAIESIARSARLTSLAAFGDNRPVPDDFGGDPDDLAEILGEWSVRMVRPFRRTGRHSLARRPHQSQH